MGSVLGGPVGSIASGVGAGALLGGTGVGGAAKNLLFGRKGGGRGPLFEESQRNLKSALGIQQVALEQLTRRAQEAQTGAVERADVAREQQFIRGGGQDRLRSLQQRIAQRGLGRSAIGLGAQRDISRGVAQRLQAVQASLPGRIRQARDIATTRAFRAGTQAIGGSPLGAAVIGTPRQRVGGILPGIGALAGGLLGGGLQGAQIGAGAGTIFQGAAR